MMTQRLGCASWLAAAASFGLASCGGGGGGGTPDGGVTTPPPPAAFTWSNNLKPGATVSVKGWAQEVTYLTSPATGTNFLSGPTPGDATFVETLSAAGGIVALAFTGPAHGANFSTAAGDTIDASGFVIKAKAKDASYSAIAIDPLQLGWNYQSVGVWENHTFSNDRGVNYDVGVVSVGAATAAGAVATTGRATFRGQATAFYTGDYSLGVAPVTLNADFTAHSVDFTTGGFRLVSAPDPQNTGLQGYLPDVALIGGMTYAAGSNQLTGTVRTVGLVSEGRTGVVSGQFYGPAAQEIGGLFTVNLGDNKLVGSYGATATPKVEAAVSWSGKTQAISYSWGGPFGGSGVGQFYEVKDTVLSVTRNAAGAVAGAQFTGPYQADFNNRAFVASADGSLSITGTGVVGAALVANTTQLGWNYQTFGAWAQLGTYVTVSGAASAGLATAGGAIPTTGTATFKGKAGGYDAVSTLLSADVTLNADFAARSVGFASTAFTDLSTGATLNATALTGSMTYSAGANALSGTVKTVDGHLTGSISGQFYGPAAEEIGGLFALAPVPGSAKPSERLGGAFGAKR